MNTNQINVPQGSELAIELSKTHDCFLFSFNHVHYLLCAQMLDEVNHSLTINYGKKSFICCFQRFISLDYFKKLKNLLSTVRGDFRGSKQWIAMYEVISFPEESMTRYTYKQPSYGARVITSTNNQGQTSSETRIISNCFSTNGQFFYFLENEGQHRPVKQLGITLSNDRNDIIGLQFEIGQMVLCLSFNMVLQTTKTVLKIDPSISYILSKTVYLQLNGSNSTGTMISPNKILTVKHAFSSKDPSIGQQINFKIYPYLKTYRAFICVKSTLYDIDGVLLQVKLRDNYIQPEGKIQTDSSRIQLQHESVSKIDSLVKVGEQVRAVGFGKYNYSLSAFNKVDLMLPTILRGIISKRMELKSQLVLFKTDANLYHGFSGCGIWRGNNHIGMAVFIIKNTTTFCQLNRHNFSYCRSFIDKYLLGQERQNINSQLRQYIRNVDKFGVRKKMVILPRL